jgi:hypothetical protein
VTLPGGSAALPAVTVTSPGEGALFEPLDTITVIAAASGGTGGIAKVEFFANWVKLGEDETAPYSFDWEGVPAGVYTMTARAVGDDGWAAADGITVEITAPTSSNAEPGRGGIEHHIYPNPLSGSARLEYILPDAERVAMSVYDISGKRIKTVFSGWRGGGVHTAHLSSSDLAPGVYLYRLAAGSVVETGKLMVLR